MHRLRLKSVANKNGKKEDIWKQRNKVVRMNKLAKMKLYWSVDMSNHTNHKRFWKNFKPLFSNNS